MISHKFDDYDDVLNILPLLVILPVHVLLLSVKKTGRSLEILNLFRDMDKIESGHMHSPVSFH